MLSKEFKAQAVRVLRSAQTTTYYPTDGAILKQLADYLDDDAGDDKAEESAPEAKPKKKGRKKKS